MAKFHNWEHKFNELRLGQNQNDLLRKWITEGIDEKMIKWAEKFGKYLAEKNEYAVDENEYILCEFKNKIYYLDKNKENVYEKIKGEYKLSELNKSSSCKKINLENLTSSQLRKFFGALKALQNEILMDSGLQDDSEISNYNHQLLMLKPQLAYAAARAKSGYAKNYNFHEVISTCIDHVRTKKQFKNFISLVEAIVAYHKVEEKN